MFFCSGLITAAFKLKRKALENTFKVKHLSCAMCMSRFHVEAIAVAVQDDLVELYAGNNNDSKMKTKNANGNQAVNGILVSSV